MTTSASGASDSLRLEILGPLRLWRAGIELDPGPPQQAYLLALLLARVGRPIGMNELFDLLWERDAPASAMNAIHKYVGALRRLLEPGLQARESGSYVHRSPSGYVFRPAPGVLDLVEFRHGIEEAEGALTRQHMDEALERLVEALGLWDGPAGEGLGHRPVAVPIFTALDEEFYATCAVAAELAVSSGRPQRVLPHLQLAAKMGPLREAVQAQLATTLAATGQQAAALSVLGEVRARLAGQLGIAPGATVQAAYRQVLAQTPTPSVVGDEVVASGTDGDRAQPRSEAVGRMVGRTQEFAVLRDAFESASAGGVSHVIVEGEPGIGKTRLLEVAAATTEQHGMHVIWGHCREGGGTPSMWPWVQAIGRLIHCLNGATRDKWLAGELGRLVAPQDHVADGRSPSDSGAQFRLFEQAVAVVGEVSAIRPVMLIIDDLQWADVASLHLFGHLVGRLPPRTALFGALRTHAPVPGSELTRMLADASRVSGHRRIRLGPLDPAEIAELVRRETGQTLGAGVVRSIFTRTSGNPFFVQELSRFFASDGREITEGATSRADVPTTVRDVIQDRMSGLDDAAQELLQSAAIIGPDADVALLARVAGIDVQTCLERLEPIEELGLLVPASDTLFWRHFSHDLIRESVLATTSRSRTLGLHLRVADALEAIDPSGESTVERLAHHLWAAGPLSDPARTANALLRSSRHAATKFVLDTAERQLKLAVRVAKAARLPELELTALRQLTTVVGMRSLYGVSALDLLERAEELSRELGQEVAAAGFLYSRWIALAAGIQLNRSGPLARRLFDQGEASADPIVRAYGLEAWGLHQWAIGEVSASHQHLSEANRIMRGQRARYEEDQVRRDFELLMDGSRTEISALHGDVAGARAQFDAMEATVGDDPYAITVWATSSARTASMAGDPAWALRVAGKGIDADPEFSFVFMGTYQRLAQCWARAVTGQAPTEAAAEAEQIIVANLLDPPRTCVATWYGLLAEMWLSAGASAEAAAALDRADELLETYGQRYAEALLLLIRARLMRADGEPVGAVRRRAEAARALAIGQGAHLFARRAEDLLAELADDA